MTDTARVWVLLGHRKGDNNQALALAEALHIPFETRSLDYNPLHIVGAHILGRSLISLTRESRARITPPWPDLIIAIGRRSVPIARWIRAANGGATRVVRIGHPRLDPRHFDLVVTTRQYPVPPGKNVALLPLAMSRYRRPPEATEAEIEALAGMPRPHLLMAIGGATKYWRMSEASLVAAAGKLSGRAANQGGSLLIVGSQRTPQWLLHRIRQMAESNSRVWLLPAAAVRFPILLDHADEIFVTGDSVSMLSEAVLTGKPVGLIPIEQSLRGRLFLGSESSSNRLRDLRRFWNYLESQKLVGTVDNPSYAKIDDPTAKAATAVRELLSGFGKAPATVLVDQRK